MKRIFLLAAVVAAFIAPKAMAQTGNVDAPDVIQRIGVGYDLTTLYPKGADNVYFNGFTVGYNADFRVSQSLPLYVGTGLNARFNFYEKELIDDEYLGAIEQDAHVTMINLNVPVNLSYRVPVSDGFYLTPEVGLDLRFQVYDHAKIDTDIEAAVPGMNLGEFHNGSTGVNLLSKDQMGNQHLRWFQLGWHAGLNFEYQRFSLGLSYGTDFVKLHKNLGAGHFLATVGYRF